jgi:hypothetical protein
LLSSSLLSLLSLSSLAWSLGVGASSGLAWHWPIPSSPGAVLHNLDRAPTRPSPQGTGDAPAGAPDARMEITITVRSKLDITVVCRARGQLFNQDLPPGAPAACTQVVGEKGEERIEDTNQKKGAAKR